MRFLTSFLFSAVFAGLLCVEGRAAVRAFDAVAVVQAGESTRLQARYAEVLRQQIRQASKVRLLDATPDSHDGVLTVLLGMPDAPAIAAGLEALREAPPTEQDPGPEGFLLRTLPGGAARILLTAHEEQGILYGIGELLRQMTFHEDHVTFPAEFRLRTAPAFEVRGTEVSQGYTIRELTNSREWTEEEWQEEVMQFVLAGANTFSIGHVSSDIGGHYEFVKGLGLRVRTSISPNGGSGPEEWGAVESIGRTGHLCLSVPEARAHILQNIENRMRNTAHIDYVQFYSGDGGGCECLDCMPYGKTYIEMCEDIAAIIHRHQPHVEIHATNQKLDNAGDKAIFEYLQNESPAWMRAWSYGPGSNAMGWKPGRRQDHRMDLFRYRGFGQIDRYLREILHQLPPQVDIIFFTDATHWVYSQYGLMDHALIADRDYHLPPMEDRWLYERHPDRAMQRVYNRRTFHARPRAYHEVFQHTHRYGIGDVTYSEGHHDHFNQWMFQRLLWRPLTSVEDVVAEYARTFFGPEAAETMAEAIFLLEENLSTPIADNDGVDRLIALLREAGGEMPAWTLERDYLWRQYLQKALMDKYIQLRLRQQLAVQAAVEAAAGVAVDNGAYDAAISEAQAAFASEEDTPEMRALLEELEQLGQETNERYGVRNEGFFNRDQDFVGLGWLKHQVNLAAEAGEDAQAEILRLIAHYEDPGEGGFYDDAGNPEKSPRLVYGWPYGDGRFAGFNRPSQRRAAFTTDEEVGVTFQYEELDPEAAYRVRLTLVRPRHLPRFAVNQHQTSQSIYADDHLLAENLELPQYEAEFFEFDIPREATADGRLKLWFKKQPGIGEGPLPEVTVWRNTGGWGTLVSEVWLMRR